MTPIHPRYDPPSDEAPSEAVVATVDDVGRVIVVLGDRVTIAFAEPSVTFTIWLEESFHGGARWSAQSSSGGDPVVLGERDPLTFGGKLLARVSPVRAVGSAALPLVVTPDSRLAWGFDTPRRLLILPPGPQGDAPFGPITSTFARIHRLPRETTLGLREDRLVVASAAGVEGAGGGSAREASEVAAPLPLAGPFRAQVATGAGEPPFAILLSPDAE